MLITKEIEIDAGHRVPSHKGKCKNLHGHRYKIEVGVDDKVISTPGSSKEGMVIDFGDLKIILLEEIDAIYDHSFIVYENDEFIDFFNKILIEKGQKINIVSFIPTAENLAKHWYELLKEALEDVSIKIHHVKVYETPTSSATYQE